MGLYHGGDVDILTTGRCAGLFLVVLMLALGALAAGCSDAVVDADTAYTRLRLQDSLEKVKERMRLLDSIREAESLHYLDSIRQVEELRRADSIRYADSLRVAEELRRADSIRYADSLANCRPVQAWGAIYFKPPYGVRSWAELSFVGHPSVKVMGDPGPGATRLIELRMVARIDSALDYSLQNFDAPAYIHLNVRVAVNGGKGSQSLMHDPAVLPEESGLGVVYRVRYGSSPVVWMATNGTGNVGVFRVEELNENERTFSAVMEAAFTYPCPLNIERVKFTFKY